MRQDRPITKVQSILRWSLFVLWLALFLYYLLFDGRVFIALCCGACSVFYAVSAIQFTRRYRFQQQLEKLHLSAIVAVYADWGIGCDGTQPIVVKADRKHFREITQGAAVIVGRKTLADFPGGKPLPGRRNIVLTRQKLDIPGAETAGDAEKAISLVAGEEKAFLIGGASAYDALLPYAERIYVTKIDAEPESDVFFPDLDAVPGWEITERSGPMLEDGLMYEFLTYEKK